MDEDEDFEPEPEPLRIRALRDGSLDVTLGGIPIEVSTVDIDEATIERLQKMPRTVRDA